ncbi:unnamed protein product, partial [Ectocarpus sp. 12 AP-2014]
SCYCRNSTTFEPSDKITKGQDTRCTSQTNKASLVFSKTALKQLQSSSSRSSRQCLEKTCSTNGKQYRVPYDVLCRPHALLGCALLPAGRNINFIRSNLGTCLPVGHTGSSEPPYRDIGLETD